jgi:hypothetical protein
MSLAAALGHSRLEAQVINLVTPAKACGSRKGASHGQPVVHFEIIGREVDGIGTYS